MTGSIFTSLKTRLAACCNLVLEHSALERPANRLFDQEHRPLSHAGQLACAAGVIEDPVANFGRVRGCQTAASRKLNAADYALQEVFAELVSVMPAVAAKTVRQTKPLAGAEPFSAESEPVVAEEDGALAA